jgi:hypothetical protein
MKDVFQLVRPDYFEPDTVRRLSVSSNTSTDEPLSSPFKDDKLDPNFEPPNSPLTTCDSDIEEAALNENRYQRKVNKHRNNFIITSMLLVLNVV